MLIDLQMQKAIRKHARLYGLAVILLISGLVFVSLWYEFGNVPQTSAQTSPQGTGGPVGGATGGPDIFATVSFPSASGFVTVVHPTSGTIEFVLLPNSVGQITVSYTSQSNNLTMFSFPCSISVLNVNLSTGSWGADSGSYCTELNVTQSSLTWVSIHQVDVKYTITSGTDNGLYVLELPSTILSTIVNVGTQPYTGPLTWFIGKIYN
jgi:hypothetical protein